VAERKVKEFIGFLLLQLLFAAKQCYGPFFDLCIVVESETIEIHRMGLTTCISEGDFWFCFSRPVNSLLNLPT
jgi:hypothetical protein